MQLTQGSTQPAANDDTYPVSDLSRVRLFGGRGSNRKADIGAVIDQSLYGVVSYSIDGQPFATPTMVWRDGDDLYFHGSAGSRMLKHVSEGDAISINFTHLDGFVLSRLASAHTLNYRSVMVFGRCKPVESPEERQAQLKIFLETRFPGRWDEVKQPTLHELKSIIMVRMRIDEASLKRRAGPPADGMEIFGGEALYAQGCWAGELPLATAVLEPRPAARLKADVETPSYLDGFGRHFKLLFPAELAPQPRVEMMVRSKTAVAKDVLHIRLEAEGAGRLPPFAPGAHIKLGVVLPDETRDVRSYTIVDGDEDGRWCEIAVLREDAGRGGSRFIHERTAIGDLLPVHGVANDFPAAGEHASALLVAGGIGVTPMLAMARHLLAQGVDVQMHYSARGAATAAFRHELETLAGPRFHFHDTAVEGASRLDIRALLGTHAPGRHLYVCGPAGMVEEAIAAARAAGFPDDAVHHELFKAAPPRVSDRPIKVVLKRSGAELDVNPGTSILDAVLAKGVPVPHSCKRGECGECAVRVVDGMPSNRDHVLSAEQKAGGLSCICVTWSDSPTLILDL